MPQKELAWICAIMPENYVRQVKALCQDANRGIGLSENVFKFPLHISLKKSFMTDRFPEIRERVISYFQSRGSFQIHVNRLVVHEGMLWLEINNGGELQQVHKDLDKLLLEEFGIAQHRFDKQFAPHISLFTDRNKDKINDMYDAICEDLSPEHLTVTQIVVGADRERDTFFNI